MATPVTRYAKSGDVHVAYQVFGSGPIDLVFVPGFVSHVENYWEHPALARWLLRLGRNLPAAMPRTGALWRLCVFSVSGRTTPRLLRIR